MSDKEKHWDHVITSGKSIFALNLKEIFRYRDLILLFVKRDFIANYKQTILGPLWHIIQPVLTTITFIIIFGRIAGLSSDGTPRMLFYMSGIIIWSYFALCLTKTSSTFLANAHIFSKVYFPRIAIPVSVVISNAVSFGIQFVLFLCIALYLHLNGTWVWEIIWWKWLLIPFLLLLVAFLGLSSGILVSSLTTKYRDINFLVGFAVQLLMFISPVIFPLSQTTGKLKLLLLSNPMTPVIEAFRNILTGRGELNGYYLLYSIGFAVLLLIISLFLFARIERNFTDTI